MRKVAILAAATIGLGGAAILPGSQGHSPQQIAQETRAQAERQAAKSNGPVTPSQQRGSFGLGGGRDWGAPSVGGYRKRPHGTHKQNRRAQMRLNAKRRARR